MNEFDEIRPYEVGEMKQAFEELLADRQFSLLLKGFVPLPCKHGENRLHLSNSSKLDCVRFALSLRQNQ